MRKKISKYFFNFFSWILCNLFTPLLRNLKHMAKNTLGRPKNKEKKEAVNIYMNSKRAHRLRIAAAEQQKTISIVVENALEKEGI